MFQNINSNYSGADATVEISIMLLGAFVLGYLLRYFFDRRGADCKNCHYYRKLLLKKDSQGKSGGSRILNTPEEVLLPAKKIADDLKVIEGIGPKIESLLNNAGIWTWKELAQIEIKSLSSILRKEGDHFRIHDPSTWPAQGRMALEGRWEDLKKYQSFLSGGKER